MYPFPKKSFKNKSARMLMIQKITEANFFHNLVLIFKINGTKLSKFHNSNFQFEVGIHFALKQAVIKRSKN